MFEGLSKRLGDVFDKLRGRGALSEADVDAALREVRTALLEADVALPVVRQFVDEVRPKAIGADVIRSVTPGQMVDQDRQRSPGRDAGRHGLGPRPRRHAPGRHPDGRPSGLGQDHLLRQDRLSPQPGTAGHGRRIRRFVLGQAQGHDGLARHPAPGRAAAAQDSGRADRRPDPADRPARDAARHHPARARDRQARRLRRPDPRHRRPALDRRRADEGGGRHQRRWPSRRRRCSSPTP
jgi:hypothetical protein